MWKKIPGTVALAALAFCAAAAAETVYLKDGRPVCGKLTDHGEILEVVTAAGASIFVDPAQVERVEKVALPEYDGKEKNAPRPSRTSGITLVQGRVKARNQAREILLSAGTGQTSLRRLTKRLLEIDPFPTETVIDALKEEKPETRALAVHTLSEQGAAEGARALAWTSIADADEDVRYAAATSVGRMKTDAGRSALTSYAKRARTEFDCDRVAYAVSNVASKEVVDALVSYAQLEVKVAYTSSVQMQEIPLLGAHIIPTEPPIYQTVTLPIHFPAADLAKVHTTVSCPVVSIVERVLSQDFGGNAGAAARWWNERRAAFQFNRREM